MNPQDNQYEQGYGGGQEYYGQPQMMPGQEGVPGQDYGQMQNGVPMQEGMPMMQQEEMYGQPMSAADLAAAQGMQGVQGAQGANQNAGQPGVEVRHDEPTSTQATSLISELRDDIVIMKDGSFRAVVACNSINFDLMSEAEKDGVESYYQQFVNSLDFTTQILIRSQRVDIGPYIDRLVNIRRNTDNMLLGVLMDDYINYIDFLSQYANIMDKSFYVVIPYYSSAEAEKDLQQTKNFFKVFSRAKAVEVTRIDRATYDKACSELKKRVSTVISGLYNLRVNAVRLKTRELAELYYNFNNPDTAVREPLVDFDKLASMYVRKGDKNEQQ